MDYRDVYVTDMYERRNRHYRRAVMALNDA